MIMMHMLHRDISKYNQLKTAEEAQEETGCKLMRAFGAFCGCLQVCFTDCPGAGRLIQMCEILIRDVADLLPPLSADRAHAVSLDD